MTVRANQSGVKAKMALIDRLALLTVGKLKVKVRILDFKRSYNRDRFLVGPLAGKGKAWVEKLEVIRGE